MPKLETKKKRVVAAKHPIKRPKKPPKPKRTLTSSHKTEAQLDKVIRQRIARLNGTLNGRRLYLTEIGSDGEVTLRDFANALLVACDNIEGKGRVRRVEGIFEQLKYAGPWNVTIHVVD